MKNNATRWTLIILLMITGSYIVIDHGRHVVPYLPFAFLLGCLFMHLFMHGGHEKRDDGGDRHHRHNSGSKKE